jgi:hypothetical protein
MPELGYCLSSQEIEELVSEGIISGNINPDNIQPSSFDPVIGGRQYESESWSRVLIPLVPKIYERFCR